GYWFGSGTVSRTLSIADKDTTDIRSWRGGVRFGRRWLFGERNILAPYIGVNYLHLDARVSGTTRLRDALPGGEDLTVRYTGLVENLDEMSGAFGLGIGLKNGMNFNLEYNRNDPSDQLLLSIQQRF
ncbi:MAG: autotransporter outer membrane beta-barrel domain-containing protein, partial [Woeseiaceae bacterium]